VTDRKQVTCPHCSFGVLVDVDDVLEEMEDQKDLYQCLSCRRMFDPFKTEAERKEDEVSDDVIQEDKR